MQEFQISHENLPPVCVTMLDDVTSRNFALPCSAEYQNRTALLLWQLEEHGWGPRLTPTMSPEPMLCAG